MVEQYFHGALLEHTSMTQNAKFTGLHWSAGIHQIR